MKYIFFENYLNYRYFLVQKVQKQKKVKNSETDTLISVIVKL